MSRSVEVTNEGSFIPASQRPDGSWRKPRRVKEGYVPQEEVPLYESKGKQWRDSRANQYPVGYDPSIIRTKEAAKQTAARSSIPGLVIETEGKKKKKKKKSGESVINEQSQKKNSRAETLVNSTETEWQTVQSKSTKNAKTTESTTPNTVPAMVDPAKRLKNLKKKLREIEAIEAKIASGEVKKPDKDQIEKVNRKTDVVSEIFALELSVAQ